MRLLPRNEERHCIFFFFLLKELFRATEDKSTHIFATFVFIINPEKQGFRKILSAKQQTSQQQHWIQESNEIIHLMLKENTFKAAAAAAKSLCCYC